MKITTKTTTEGMLFPGDLEGLRDMLNNLRRR